MNNRESIQIELQDIAPALLSAGNDMPYVVPDAYFDNFSAIMLAKVAAENRIQQEVPAGYFESLPQLMLQKIRQQSWQDELKSVAPTLLSAPRQMPYNVPQGYFESLANAAVGSVKPAPVVMFRNATSGRWMRYAAVILLLLSTFGIFRLANSPLVESTSPNLDRVQNSSNTSLSTDTLTASVLSQLSALDEASLDASLSDIGVPAEARSPLYYLNTTDFEAALQDFSADDLNSHLQGQTTLKSNI